MRRGAGGRTGQRSHKGVLTKDHNAGITKITCRFVFLCLLIRNDRRSGHYFIIYTVGVRCTAAVVARRVTYTTKICRNLKQNYGAAIRSHGATWNYGDSATSPTYELPWARIELTLLMWPAEHCHEPPGPVAASSSAASRRAVWRRGSCCAKYRNLKHF
ncbi:hypothetical protein E2C01_041325 [Portunus trituberculatus]|uniref:Uncharacterized protein n=1 Tax=Portunus trituberculatus TaxID=210409 RepID=A0A5B7FQ48_PORTR|nr:hypothetical protein [Portunus trituberculatus]